MELAQRELLGVLLERICSLGLISESTWSGAMDLVHTSEDLPALFRAAGSAEGGGGT